MEDLILSAVLLAFFLLLSGIFVLTHKENKHKNSTYSPEKVYVQSYTEVEKPRQLLENALQQFEPGKVSLQLMQFLKLDTLSAENGINLSAERIDIDQIKSQKIVKINCSNLRSSNIRGEMILWNYNSSTLKSSLAYMMADKEKTRDTFSVESTNVRVLTIPPYSIVREPIVFSGDVFVGKGSIFLDILKIEGNLQVEDLVFFKESVMVSNNLVVGSFCRTQSYFFVKKELAINGPFFFFPENHRKSCFLVGKKIFLKKMIIGTGDVISSEPKGIFYAYE
jgi:hypothetical protein